MLALSIISVPFIKDKVEGWLSNYSDFFLVVGRSTSGARSLSNRSSPSEVTRWCHIISQNMMAIHKYRWTRFFVQRFSWLFLFFVFFGFVKLKRSVCRAIAKRCVSRYFSVVTCTIIVVSSHFFKFSFWKTLIFWMSLNCLGHLFDSTKARVSRSRYWLVDGMFSHHFFRISKYSVFMVYLYRVTP